jgi:plasmid stabilization system protein ParE
MDRQCSPRNRWYCRIYLKRFPKYAQILVKQIYEMVTYLENFPKFGRKVPEYNDTNLREILYKNYRIIYLIKENHLEIISIIHGSRKLKL